MLAQLSPEQISQGFDFVRSGGPMAVMFTLLVAGLLVSFKWAIKPALELLIVLMREQSTAANAVGKATEASKEAASSSAEAARIVERMHRRQHGLADPDAG